MEKIFEQATRQKLRFESARGLLSVEDLWDVPLLSRDSFNLNSMAKSANAVVKASGDEDFVPTARKPSAEDQRNVLRLEVLKAIISVKFAEQTAAAARAERAAKREKFIELLARKQDAELEQLSADEIRAELAKLDD